MQIDANQCVQVSGPLTFTTGSYLWKQGKQIIKCHPELVFDLHQVTDIDSSSLALLVGWIKYAKALGCSIKFFHVPTKLHTIAKLSGFDQVIAQWIN